MNNAHFLSKFRQTQGTASTKPIIEVIIKEPWEVVKRFLRPLKFQKKLHSTRFETFSSIDYQGGNYIDYGCLPCTLRILH